MRFFTAGATACLVLAGSRASAATVETLYSWNVLDYIWDAEGLGSRNESLASGAFIPSQNALAGVKISSGVVYATVPRWTKGVPSTLNKVVTLHGAKSAVLDPYPSAWFNDLANPDGLKYVQSMEIDTQGRMWIIDVGRTDTTGNNVVHGKAKVVLWDIAKNVEIDRFELPEDVVDPESNFLNDIVVDEARMMAYISDANQGLIVVVDMARKRAQAFEDLSTKAEGDVGFTIQGVEYEFNTPEDGIALTTDGEETVAAL